MKTAKKTALLLCCILALAACRKDESTGDGNDPIAPNTNDTTQTESSDLETFDVALDNTPLVETETIDSEDDDFWENSDFANVVKITYNGDSATVENAIEGVTIEQTGANIAVVSTVKKVEYILSGQSSDGSFAIESDNKFKLTLNGVSLTSSTTAPINSSCSKRMYLHATDGTVNSFTDAAESDAKACVYHKGNLVLSGSGSLKITANKKQGLTSNKGYVRFRANTNTEIVDNAGNAVKAGEGITVSGGVINISVTADAAKGFSSDGYVVIDGGRTTIITSGGGVYDEDESNVSGCAGIKADSILVMNGGELALKSTGAGGKCINIDKRLIINGGTVRAITTGTEYVYGSYDTSAKAIKADSLLAINGGSVKVRATGGEGSEGLESKDTLRINGGTVEISTYDDCMNATTHIEINGGSVYCYSSNNDALDSNGTIALNGGTVVASGTQTPEGSFDCDQNRFAITGGTIVGVGGDASTPTESACTQPAIVYGTQASANTVFNLATSDGTHILSYKVPRSYNQMTLLVSSPSLQKGNSVLLTTGGTVTGGTTWHGLTTGGTLENGTTVASLTLSKMVTTQNTSGGGPNGGDNHGGGGPGGRP